MSKRKKQFKRLPRHAGPLASTPPPPPPPPLNLGYLEAATVKLRPWDRCQIVIVGCGGIGAYVAQHVARIMRVVYESRKGINLTLVDPDHVEAKNLGRQLFVDAEVGLPKALALARRYGLGWGVQTLAVAEHFDEKFLIDADLTILIGCVDNHAARQTLHNVLRRNPEQVWSQDLPSVWWLDCGNLRDTGRVLLGSAYDSVGLTGVFEGKVCYGLPSPGMQFPTLLIPDNSAEERAAMSCAELAALNLQSLNINAAVAVQAADMLTRLLITEDLRRYQCAVNVASGSVKSYYVTPEDIARDSGKPVSFLIAPERARPRQVVDQLLTQLEA